jgi:aspartyl-tRNA(Asn)/glutamyl-tRNA(Gln) amidotransferase subunit A
MSALDPTAATATEIAARVRCRDLSAREVAAAAIARVERLNPALNALVRFDGDAVLDEATEVDAALATGDSAPMLPGVLFTAKDNLWVGGRTVSQGSRLFERFVAPASALPVDRARTAGGVLLGTSNCSEFACKGVTTNLLFGPTRNPWQLGRTPGGSSGGAAAAVAAGLGHVALCTDGGGSTRRPAAHCGVVGFKPSAGAIAHPVGFAEPVFGNSVVGIMARTVADVAAVFDAVAGADPRDPLCVDGQPSQKAAAGLGRPALGLRVALSPRLGLEVPVDAEVVAAIDAAAQWLAEDGAIVERADPRWPEGTNEEALMPLQFGGLAALYGERFRREPQLFDPDIAAQIERGLSLSAADVARALLHREAMFKALAELFAHFDLLLAPTTPCTAWPLADLGPREIGGRPVAPRAHAVFTPAFNHCFMPACSVPVALDRNGLPIGAQIAGRRFADADVLRTAARLEQRSPELFRRPRELSASTPGHPAA